MIRSHYRALRHIAFGMTAFLIVLALKARSELGNDHVDGMSYVAEEQENKVAGGDAK